MTEEGQYQPTDDQQTPQPDEKSDLGLTLVPSHSDHFLGLQRLPKDTDKFAFGDTPEGRGVHLSTDMIEAILRRDTLNFKMREVFAPDENPLTDDIVRALESAILQQALTINPGLALRIAEKTLNLPPEQRTSEQIASALARIVSREQQVNGMLPVLRIILSSLEDQQQALQVEDPVAEKKMSILEGRIADVVRLQQILENSVPELKSAHSKLSNLAN